MNDGVFPQRADGHDRTSDRFGQSLVKSNAALCVQTLFQNLWQQYRVYPDRIELQCWIALHTLKIPVREIADIQIRSPFSLWDLFRGKASLSLRGVKIDQSDLCRHIVIARKLGLFRHIVFTPDNPDEFADIVKLLMEHADKIGSLLENEE